MVFTSGKTESIFKVYLSKKYNELKRPPHKVAFFLFSGSPVNPCVYSCPFFFGHTCNILWRHRMALHTSLENALTKAFGRIVHKPVGHLGIIAEMASGAALYKYGLGVSSKCGHLTIS